MDVAALAVPFVPFFKSFMSKAGEDAYLALKHFVEDHLSKNAKGLFLEDSDGVRVELEADLPDEAFRQLLHTDPAELGFPNHKAFPAALRWDPQAGGWGPPHRTEPGDCAATAG